MKRPNPLQAISAWDKFTDEDEKLRKINNLTSCKNVEAHSRNGSKSPDKLRPK
jgi:hypothetical protein